MNAKTLDEIESKTRDILEELNGSIDRIDPPVNLSKILEQNNLKLAMASFKDSSVAGAFDKEQKTIFLSKFDSPKRQMFTVAHELGHIILGHKKKFDVFYRQQTHEFNGSDDAKDEKEANYFAASLLMPKELVQKFWEIHHDIELLAAYFGVSRSAAYWRLKNLRLI
jgi:Zn-dependent peptidase ImmA (M78 family)